jgi:Domain of unknown function (DUF4124)
MEASMSRRNQWSAIFVGLAWLSLAGHQALAQKVYKWTDKQGKIHFSNVGPEGESAGEPTSVAQGTEAQAPSEVTAAAPTEANRASNSTATAGSEEGSGKFSELSEEEFSSKASSTRMRLRRELAQAKAQSDEAADKLAELRKEYNQRPQMGIGLLQKVYGPTEHPYASEEDLLKEKAKADKRIEEIRKEYAELHDEAVKRLGHQPSWWLPLD